MPRLMLPAWNWNLTVSISYQKFNCRAFCIPIQGILNGIILIVECLREFWTNYLSVKIPWSYFLADTLAFIFRHLSFVAHIRQSCPLSLYFCGLQTGLLTFKQPLAYYQSSHQITIIILTPTYYSYHQCVRC